MIFILFFPLIIIGLVIQTVEWWSDLFSELFDRNNGEVKEKSFDNVDDFIAHLRELQKGNREFGDYFPTSEIGQWISGQMDKAWPTRRLKQWFHRSPLGTHCFGRVLGFRILLPYIPWHCFTDYVRTGFYCSEAWGFNYETAVYALPRLKELKKVKHGIPMEMFDEMGLLDYTSHTEEQTDAASKRFDAYIDQMIWSFEYIVSGRQWEEWNQEEWDRHVEGLRVFGKYYHLLSD